MNTNSSPPRSLRGAIARSRLGITFMEVLLAIVLMVALLWPLYDLFRFTMHGAAMTGDITIAINMATQVIELLKNRSFDALDYDNPANKLSKDMDEDQVMELLKATIRGAEKIPTLGVKNFWRKVTLDLLEPRASPWDGGRAKYRFCQIVCEVWWKDKNGNQRGPVRLATLVANESVRFH